MATYIAMTTHNFQQNGMNKVVCAGSNRKAVEAAALADRELSGTDIYADTYRKNLVIVSKTQAKRRYGFDFDAWEPTGYEIDHYRWVK